MQNKILPLMILYSSMLFANEIEVIPSSTEIGIDDNVSIELRITTNEMNAEIGNPSFEAPDFEEVNVFAQTQQSFETSIINGQTSVRKSQSSVIVLHPKKEGRLLIRNIKVNINGKLTKANDVTIEVFKASTGSKKNNYLGQNNYGNGGLPSARIQNNAGRNENFFIKTELSKNKVYKGEQIILTYVLYSRVPILNIQIERYPNINGFLKEDIDIPVMRNPLTYTRAVMNGVEYRRAVLAQFAIYPLKEGMLPVDALTGKFTYRVNRGGMGLGDDDDAFGMFNQFFQAMQGQTATKASDRISVEVLPLPANNQPPNFLGLVGEFDISAAVDKYSLKSGEPLNLKVKIEGKGHAGSLENLNIAWPSEFELFENKSNTHFLKTGMTERLFEFMVIPKVSGKFKIPAIEIAMFNPDSKNYEIKKTQPIEIDVAEGVTGKNYAPSLNVNSNEIKNHETPKEDIRYWLSEGSKNASSIFNQILNGFALISFLFLIFSILKRIVNSQNIKFYSKNNDKKLLNDLRNQFVGVQFNKQKIDESFKSLEQILTKIIYIRTKVTITSVLRSELKDLLKLTDSQFFQLEKSLQICENIRYSSPDANQSDFEEAKKHGILFIDEFSQIISE